jgi:hypothetical protein
MEDERGWRELRVLSYVCSRAVLHIMQVARTLSKPTSPHMSQGSFCRVEEYQYEFQIKVTINNKFN